MSPTQAPVRLAVVLSHPTQYYSPWFRWIRANASVELRVFYLWDFGVTPRVDPEFGKTITWDVDLLSGYESEFVPNIAKAPGAEHFSGFNNPEITRRIGSWRPNAVLLFGYRYITHLRVIAWARLNRIPILFRGDSHFLGRGRPALPKRLIMQAVFAQFLACLFVGAANRDYFRGLGVPDKRLFFCPHCVNESLFNPERPEYSAQADVLRAKLGLDPDTRVVLFAGKLVPAKQPYELLRAFLEVARGNTALVIIGDGVERSRLAAAANELLETKGGPKVRLLPFVNQSEMPSHLKLADVFVLPSRGFHETWGLAVNEAMHMNVPCLVSDRVGCQRDLVTQGETGWVFPADEPDSLAPSLRSALGDLESPVTRARIKVGVRKRIARYTYSHATEGLIAALATLRRQPQAPL